MTRNLIVLGCAALLAIGLSFGSFAGSVPDADSDGVPDNFDNCVDVANGPLAGTGLCNGQEDATLDGYGNPCDYDPNDDGASGPDDLAAMLDNVAAVSTNPVFDNNCDGAAGPDDLAAMLDNVAAVAQPGPTGLVGCANTAPATPPCVAP
jgi:hypothetical protein